MSKNIAILSTTYLPTQGGIQYLLWWLLKEIDENFNFYKEEYNINNFYFIAPSLKNNEYAVFKNIKLLEIGEPNTKFGKIVCIIKLFYYIKKFNIDLIHTQSAYFDSLCCNLVKRFTGLRYIITSHGEDLAYIEEFSYGGRLSKVGNFIITNNVKNTNIITTISKDMYKFANEIVKRDKLYLIPNPIPIENKVNNTLINKEIEKIKKRYNIYDDQIVCLTLSGARKIKGHKNMIYAFHKAYIKNNNLRLFIAAHGEQTKNLKNLVKKLDLGNVVYFIGFITGAKKEAFFKLADIYVNTAYFEPFGLVYLEAIEKSIVNLASNQGGGKDIFTHLKNGYLIDPYSIESIYQGFIYLSKKGNRLKLVNNAYKLLDKYKINKIVKQYFEVYDKVLSV